mgnify:CR=1 FL=1
MKYIYINDEIISIENILSITKNEKESIIRISYILPTGKVLQYELDYSEQKIDPNKKETPLQQDFKKLKNKICKVDRNV